jgi:hypothetical protein
MLDCVPASDTGTTNSYTSICSRPHSHVNLGSMRGLFLLLCSGCLLLDWTLKGQSTAVQQRGTQIDILSYLHGVS